MVTIRVGVRKRGRRLFARNPADVRCGCQRRKSLYSIIPPTRASQGRWHRDAQRLRGFQIERRLGFRLRHRCGSLSEAMNEAAGAWPTAVAPFALQYCSKSIRLQYGTNFPWPAILQIRRHLRTNMQIKGGTHDNGCASFSICRRIVLSLVCRDCIGLFC
jgi:hypothetical protein